MLYNLLYPHAHEILLFNLFRYLTFRPPLTRTGSPCPMLR